MHEFMREFEFVHEFVVNFVHEFKYEIVQIRTNFLHENWLCYKWPVLYFSFGV